MYVVLHAYVLNCQNSLIHILILTPFPIFQSSSDENEKLIITTPLIDKYPFLERKNCTSIFDHDSFENYLTTICRKSSSTANTISMDIGIFFSSLSYGSTSKYYDVLLNVDNLRDYMKTCQDERQLAPTTIAEKLRRLELAVEYTQDKEDPQKENDAFFIRCNRIKQELSKWRRSLSKDIAMQRAKHAMKSEIDVQVADDPLDFTQNSHVIAQVNEMLELGTTTSITTREYNMILAYLAASIIFENAQRPGVVQQMTVQEFKERTQIATDKTLIKVLRHKTITSRGPANVVITPDVESLMLRYYNNIRSKITPQSQEFSNRFFLTHTGIEFRKISEVIVNVAKQFGISVPTAKLHRKVVVTNADEELVDQDNRALHQHMSHSAETATRYYKFPGSKKAAKAHADIEKIMKRRHFTEAEDEKILSEWPLSKGITPTLALCTKIIERYTMERTNKQLQDRWIHLLKKLKRTSYL